MRLCDNKDLFKEIITTVSLDIDILPNYIEKDYYAISILKELVSKNNKFVFKGGTSLSVCQHIINRFSEDVDVSYEDEIITVGQRKAIKQCFFDSIESMSLSVNNPENIRSRRVFNRYTCPYLSAFGGNDTVIVEWAVITPSFPIEVKTAQTIIGKYLDDNGRHDLVELYGLESFDVKTITKERTLVDKIFAICDYHISKKLGRQSRHIYDIHQLLETIKLDNQLIDLFKKVKTYRESLASCYSAGKDMIISKLLKELVNNKTYLVDYNERTFPLLYDHVQYDECVPSILKIASFLEENGL